MVFRFFVTKGRIYMIYNKRGESVKSFLSVLMSLVLLLSGFSFCFITNAFEEGGTENEIMPCWTSIDSYSVVLDINGLTATAYATLDSSYYTNLKITAQLQKETSTGYEDVKTWTVSKTSAVTITLNESKLINPLNDYRLRVTFTADQESIVVFKYA